MNFPDLDMWEKMFGNELLTLCEKYNEHISAEYICLILLAGAGIVSKEFSAPMLERIKCVHQDIIEHINKKLKEL